jgi:hypothetical protein
MVQLDLCVTRDIYFDHKAINRVQKTGTMWRWGAAKKKEKLSGAKINNISGR